MYKLLVIFLLTCCTAAAQDGENEYQWKTEGESLYLMEKTGLVRITLPTMGKKVIVPSSVLNGMDIRNFYVSGNE